MDLASVIVTTIGILSVILIPGISLSYAFFPKQRILERLSISLLLGMTPQLVLYFLDKNFFIPTTTQTTFTTITILTITGGAIWLIRRR